MLRLFRWLIWGDAHLHHWEIIRKGAVTLQTLSGRTVPDGFYYDLQCTVCGTVKTKNT